MKLITKSIMNSLEKHPYGSQECKGKDAKVLVKFFTPFNAATWLITELVEKTEDDLILYGYCTIFRNKWEWGYVSLNELKSLKGPFGLGVERDMYSSGTVRELAS